MTTIISGVFEQQVPAEHAAEELRQAGFPHDHIGVFYVNPAGQHSAYPVGGDHDKSPGAENSTKGTVAGVAAGGTIGAVVGATTAPLTGPIGTAIGAMLGAHVGALVGSMSTMKDDGEHPEQTPPPREAGVYVAVALPAGYTEDQAINVLRSTGATDIERSQGTMTDSNWEDFDPSSPPDLVAPNPHADVNSSSSHVRKH